MMVCQLDLTLKLVLLLYLHNNVTAYNVVQKTNTNAFWCDSDITLSEIYYKVTRSNPFYFTNVRDFSKITFFPLSWFVVSLFVYLFICCLFVCLFISFCQFTFLFCYRCCCCCCSLLCSNTIAVLLLLMLLFYFVLLLLLVFS